MKNNTKQNVKSKDCIFCKLANGEFPTEKIYEDDKCIVIPDKFPLTHGQSLVIAKKHIDYLYDLDDATYQHIMGVTKKIVKATDAALKPIRCWVLVQGMEVAHNHVKIFPAFKDKWIHLEEGSGKEITNEEMREIAKKISLEL